MRTGRDDRARIPQRCNLAGGVGRRILNQRACVAHASSLGRMLPDDQRYDGLLRTGDANVVGRLLLLRPAYLADQDDDLRMRISEEQIRQSTKLMPWTGSPPIPIVSDWPRPAAVSWLMTSLVNYADRDTTPIVPRYARSVAMTPT